MRDEKGQGQTQHKLEVCASVLLFQIAIQLNYI